MLVLNLESFSGNNTGNKWLPSSFLTFEISRKSNGLFDREYICRYGPKSWNVLVFSNEKRLIYGM